MRASVPYRGFFRNPGAPDGEIGPTAATTSPCNIDYPGRSRSSETRKVERLKWTADRRMDNKTPIL